MSMMHGRDTMMIELIQATDTEGGFELLGAYEEALYDIGGRPHWGQVNTLTGPLRRMYPEFDRWLAVHDDLNASGVFDSPFSKRVGISAGKAGPSFRQAAPGRVPAMLPRMLGADTEVACVDGRMLRYVNLDYAASTPVMADVWDAVEAFVPWYSSVHRGTGVKSQVATAAYEGARDVVARFVGARPDDTVVFVRNTTEAINVLAASLPAGTRVLSSTVEHHANMLPWRAPRRPPAAVHAHRPSELLEATERALRAERIDLVAVTGASNVTGEVWPVAELARARARARRRAVRRRRPARAAPRDRHGARRDRPPRALRPQALRAVRRRRARRPPARRRRRCCTAAARSSSSRSTTSSGRDAPDRFEAGSPNVIGVVALAAACRSLMALGMDAVAAHERVARRPAVDRRSRASPA